MENVLGVCFFHVHAKEGSPFTLGISLLKVQGMNPRFIHFLCYFYKNPFKYIFNFKKKIF